MLSKFSVKKPITIFVAVVMVIVLGVVSYTSMTPDLLPNMDFPYVIIMTTYPGASPEQVETTVTKPLEQSMATLENIVNITSTSSENYSMLMLEFSDNANMDSISIDISGNIDTVKGAWPELVGTPYMMKINPNIMPVSVVAVDMETMDTVALSNFASETLLPKLEGVAGVGSVTTMGIVEEGVNVVISQEKLDAVNKTIQKALNKQFADAEKELDKAQDKINDGISQAESGKDEIEQGKETLIQAQKELSAQLANAKGELDAKQTELIEAKLQLVTKASELTTQKQQLQTVYEIAVQLQKTLNEFTGSRNTLVNTLTRLQALQKQYNEVITQMGNVIVNSEEYIQLQKQLEQINQELEKYGINAGQLADRINEALAAISSIDLGLGEIDASLEAIGMTKEGLDSAIKELESGIKQIDAGIDTLNATLTQLGAGSATINDAYKQLETQQSAAQFEMSSGLTQLMVGESTVTQTLTQLESAKGEIEKTVDDLKEQKKAAFEMSDVNNIITMDMLSGLLTAQNFSMPAGYITEDNIKYLVRVGDKVEDADELSEMLLVDMDMDDVKPIYLKDVADVFVSDNSDEIYAKINGNNGVLFSFTKQSNHATAEVSDNINAKFEELKEKHEGLSYTNLMDQGTYIYMIIDNILQNLAMGAVLAIIILFIFLKDIRPTLITALSIPISVVLAIVLMYFSGVTINMISLSGLAIGVGMIVDNSVVVIENIYRMRSKGVPVIQACMNGARQVTGALIASTLTTICVFLPIVFVEGITRQLFTDLALTLAYALLASLVIALTLVPAMGSKMLVKTKEKEHKWYDKMIALYERSLKFVLSHRMVALLVALALLIGSSAWALSKGFSFMPSTSSTEISISATMPEENSFEDTVKTSDQILERLNEFDEFETVGGMVGSLLGVIGMASGSEANSRVTVYAVVKDGIKTGDGKLEKEIEKKLADLNCEITVSGSRSMSSMSALTGSGITVNVYGDNLDQLQKTGKELAEKISAIEGVGEVDDGIDDTTPEIKITVDKAKAMAKSLTVAQVYQQISEALTTEKTATSLTNSDGSQLDVVVVQSEDKELTVDEIRNYKLTYTTREEEEKEVVLADIASIEETTSLNSISRDNQRRTLAVTAEVLDDYIVTNVSNAIQKAVDEYELPEGFSVEYAGENENTMEAVFELVKMLLLGVLLIYMIMVIQFQNLKSPFIIMFTIPLAFTGGFLALAITGFDVSIIALVGFIMLSGIIVNNGIVLVDYINSLRIENPEMTKAEAIIDAGKTRMRPILMTTLTTVLGLLTMALGIGQGVEMMQPLAIVCIGGLLYATLMTLYIVPVIYDLLNKKDIKVVKDEDLVIIDD